MRSRTGVLLVAMVTTLLAACADSSSIAGTGSSCPCFPASTPSTPAVDHGAATVYLAPDALYGQPSRYVLYADGTFLLEIGAYARTGTYVRTESVITFAWGGASNGIGVWGASAVMRGDEMSVTYNLAMALSDFENGTYTLQRSTN